MKQPPMPQRERSAVTRLFVNQATWLDRLATGEQCPHPEHLRLFRSGAVSASHTGRAGVVCLHEASSQTRGDLPDLLAALDWLRDHGAGDVLVWSAVPRPLLSRSLLAHGLDGSFEPWWMLRPLEGVFPATGADVVISQATSPDIDDLQATPAIPYVSGVNASVLQSLICGEGGTREVSVLIARDGSAIVGQAIVNVTGKMAGLFNVAVHPGARRQGIGTALTREACAVARNQGARWIGLNATPMGVGVYARLGFRHIGQGQTWSLPERRLLVPPSPTHVDIAMRLIDGDLAGIDVAIIPPSLPNGETPMTFAARSGEPGPIRWLLDHGCSPEILPLWRLGLHDEAMVAILDPDVRDRTIPPMHATALHGAVRHGEVALAKLLIDAGADLTIQDVEYRSTALGWAEALGQPEIAEMIREAGGE